MIETLVILIILAVGMLFYAWRRKPEAIRPALIATRSQLMVFALRVPMALLAAAFIATIIPTSSIAPFIGPESGWKGILLATLFGAIIPGGPILTFPLALVIWRSGAGEVQMVALLASWSIFAVHRVISYELPMLGPRFVMLRFASSWMLPLIASVVAMGLVALTGFALKP